MESFLVGSDKEQISGKGASRSRRRRQRMVLTKRDREIVRWVYEARLATRKQVHKLFFTEGGRSRCKRRLTLLYRNGYIDKLARKFVSAPDVYYISRRSSKGLRLLRSLAPEEPVEPQTVPSNTVQHTIEIGDCRVALSGACAAAGYTLSAWLGEKDLLSRMHGAGLLPDGYFQITRQVKGEPRMAGFFLEVERSGKSERTTSERFRRYGEFYYSGQYAQRFGTDALRVLFLVGDEYGIDPTRQIDRFKAMCARLQVTILRFAPLEYFISLDGHDPLFARIWHRPGADDASALFDS